MSAPDIRRAFESRLSTWAAAQSLPVAWQNVSFSPPSSAYLRAFLLPADTDSRDLAGQHREYRGVFQVSICLPEGEGPGAGEALVSALDALFPPSAPMLINGLQVYVVRPMSAAPALQEPDRYVIPVSCEYRANTYI